MKAVKQSSTTQQTTQPVSTDFVDYTADWPREELNKAIQDGLDSGDSKLDSAEKFKAYFFSKHKND